MPPPELSKPKRARRGGRPELAEAAELGDAILKAAEAIFLADGFGRARLEAIAAAAGTSKQTVYARYRSKEALFIAVSDALLRAHFRAVAPGAGDLRAQLVAVADQTLEALLDPKLVRMHSIITAEAQRFPELARMSDADETFPGRIMTHQLLATAAAAGEIACDDPHRAMLMLQQMIVAVPLRDSSLGLGGFDASAIRAWARYAVDLFLDGVRPRP